MISSSVKPTFFRPPEGVSGAPSTASGARRSAVVGVLGREARGEGLSVTVAVKSRAHILVLNNNENPPSTTVVATTQ